MKLTAFRGLLSKRVEEDDVLRNLIKTLPSDILEQAVFEALSKMGIKGTAANHATALATSHVLPHIAGDHPHESMDTALLHDSLSHHLTHYKAALKAGNRDTADQHLNQIMKTINYGAKLQHGTGGQITLASGSATTNKGAPVLIEAHPWEMNYAGSLKNEKGEYHQKTKGFGRKATGKTGNQFPDYRYMEMKPHLDHSKSKGEHQESAYPFHELMVNGRHVDIGNVAPSEKFIPHILDSHPAVEHSYTKSTDLADDPILQTKISEGFKKWFQSPELENWLAKQEENHNPERGSTKSEPVLPNAIDNPHHDVYGNRPEGANFKQKSGLAAGESTADALRRIRGETPVQKPAAEQSMFSMDLNEPAPQGPSSTVLEDIKRIRGQ